MTKNVLTKLIIAGVVCTFIVFIAVRLFSSSPGQTDAPANAPSLPVISVKEGNVTTHTTYPASIEGEADVEIRPQVEGYLSAIYVDEGQYVTRGTRLFQIDEQLYREQYNEAAANFAVSEANLEKAAIELEKSKSLEQNKVISGMQLRTIEVEYKTAQAGSLQAKATMENARIRLEFTSIKAPVDGLVGRIPFRQGSFITTANAAPLTVVSNVNRVRAYFSISEQDYIAFAERYLHDTVDVSLQLADGRTYPHKGIVDAVNGQFEKNKGSVVIRAEFPNPARILRSGNTGMVSIEQVHDNVLLVPFECTFKLQDKILVNRITPENRIEVRNIVVSGKADGSYIVTEGLEAGDLILSSGMNRVEEGMEIVPIKN